MDLLLKSVQLIQSGHPFHGQKVDILIQNGIISDIDSQISAENVTIVEYHNAYVSQGWIDVGAQIGDPGIEYKEDFESATEAAAAGGFTTVLPLPNTVPTISSKTEVNYITSNTQSHIVDYYPIGTITTQSNGLDIAELYDMHRHGAVAFIDHHPIKHSGVMQRALHYVKAFDGLVLNTPLDNDIVGKGYVHEGVMSTSLGLRGIPRLAEEMMLQRDLYLLEYSNSRLHVPNVSAGTSVDLIRKAKAKGLKVTCSVNPMNLYFTDNVLVDFDANYKVNPPVREQSDVDALIEGLKDGTIDFINSNHMPQDIEGKRLEFIYADDGVIMLETAFSVANSVLKAHMDLETIIEKFTKPAEIFKLPNTKIEKGAKANLTVFNPDEYWTFHKKDIQSKSKNTPFVGTLFKGKVLGIINGKKTNITE